MCDRCSVMLRRSLEGPRLVLAPCECARDDQRRAGEGRVDLLGCMLADVLVGWLGLVLVLGKIGRGA